MTARETNKLQTWQWVVVVIITALVSVTGTIATISAQVESGIKPYIEQIQSNTRMAQENRTNTQVILNELKNLRESLGEIKDGIRELRK